MSLPPLLVAAALAAYLLAGVVIWRALEDGRTPRGASLAAFAAVALHLVLLLLRLTDNEGMRIDLGLAMSLFAWQAALLLWLFALRQPMGVLGVVVYPAAAAMLFAAQWLPPGNSSIAELDWTLQAHIFLSLIAYGLLTLGAVQACVMAIQHRRLHDHQPGRLAASLPPLQTMETLLFRLIASGFAMLTLAIVSGAFFIEHLFAQHLAHKTVLSLLAWAFFAVLLWGRWRSGWRGQTAVRWTLGGYGLLLLAYFGSKLVLELMLGEHWT
ncbi:MAG: phosphohydrolase [Salinisphaeraceae bacterium]|nr:phosphohydrolase [Salinisphaeraceae bacterium]